METERRLGLMSLDEAAPTTDADQAESFAREAAYNLQLLYVTTNNRDLAREVARKWLTF